MPASTMSIKQIDAVSKANAEQGTGRRLKKAVAYGVGVGEVSLGLGSLFSHYAPTIAESAGEAAVQTSMGFASIASPIFLALTPAKLASAAIWSVCGKKARREQNEKVFDLGTSGSTGTALEDEVKALFPKGINLHSDHTLAIFSRGVIEQYGRDEATATTLLNRGVLTVGAGETSQNFAIGEIKELLAKTNFSNPDAAIPQRLRLLDTEYGADFSKNLKGMFDAYTTSEVMAKTTMNHTGFDYGADGGIRDIIHDAVLNSDTLDDTEIARLTFIAERNVKTAEQVGIDKAMTDGKDGIVEKVDKEGSILLTDDTKMLLKSNKYLYLDPNQRLSILPRAAKLAVSANDKELDTSAITPEKMIASLANANKYADKKYRRQNFEAHEIYLIAREAYNRRNSSAKLGKYVSKTVTEGDLNKVRQIRSVDEAESYTQSPGEIVVVGGKMLSLTSEAAVKRAVYAHTTGMEKHDFLKRFTDINFTQATVGLCHAYYSGKGRNKHERTVLKNENQEITWDSIPATGYKGRLPSPQGSSYGIAKNMGIDLNTFTGIFEKAKKEGNKGIITNTDEFFARAGACSSALQAELVQNNETNVKHLKKMGGDMTISEEPMHIRTADGLLGISYNRQNMSKNTLSVLKHKIIGDENVAKSRFPVTISCQGSGSEVIGLEEAKKIVAQNEKLIANLATDGVRTDDALNYMLDDTRNFNASEPEDGNRIRRLLGMVDADGNIDMTSSIDDQPLVKYARSLYSVGKHDDFLRENLQIAKMIKEERKRSAEMPAAGERTPEERVVPPPGAAERIVPAQRPPVQETPEGPAAVGRPPVNGNPPPFVPPLQPGLPPYARPPVAPYPMPFLYGIPVMPVVYFVPVMMVPVVPTMMVQQLPTFGYMPPIMPPMNFGFGGGFMHSHMMGMNNGMSFNPIMNINSNSFGGFQPPYRPAPLNNVVNNPIFKNNPSIKINNNFDGLGEALKLLVKLVDDRINDRDVKKGNDGKSAYELWLEIPGNEGKTREQFFESLRGPQGESIVGPKGEKGDKGDSIVGPKGDKGDSIVGPKGEKGDSIVGPKGEKGDSIVGPKGERGDKGDSIVGPKGEKGDSIVGPKGDKGDSIVGPKGDKGDKGEGGTGADKVYEDRIRDLYEKSKELQRNARAFNKKMKYMKEQISEALLTDLDAEGTAGIHAEREAEVKKFFLGSGRGTSGFNKLMAEIGRKTGDISKGFNGAESLVDEMKRLCAYLEGEKNKLNLTK